MLFGNEKILAYLILCFFNGLQLSSENHQTTAIHFKHYAAIVMVTVIIPILNEQTTISQVVKLVKEATAVTEILVIDHKSHDNTIASLVDFIQ